MQPCSLNFTRFFLVLLMLISLLALPVTPAHAASLPAEINKQFTPLQIDAGGTAVLKISIFNPNTFPLTTVAFADDLVRVQPGLYVDAPSGLVNTCGGTVIALPGSTTITLSGGAVPAQVASNPGQCYVEVNISSITTGNLINTIPAHNPPADIGLTAEGNDGGIPVMITNTSPASATITVISVSSPSLSKAFTPNTVFVGETSALSITINNNDADTNLTNVSYSDSLPAGLQVASPANVTRTGCGAGSTVDATAGGTAIALSGATVTPSINCVVTVDIRGADYGQYTNTIPAGPGGPGSLQTDQGVTNGSPASAPLNVQPVGVTKAFSPTNIDAGDTTTLTITLQNPTSSAQEVTSVRDTLPANLTVTGTPSTDCGTGSTVLYDPTPPAQWVFTGGTIPASTSPPAPGTCTIVVTLQADFSISTTISRTNTIGPNSVITSTPGFTNYNTTSSTVTINSALAGTKAYTSPSYGAIPLGGTATVTITLTNRSSTDVTDVDFTDSLPAGLTVSGTPATPQCGGGVVSNTSTSVSLADGTIAANSSCTIVFSVTSSAPGVYENTIPANDITACTAFLGCVGNGSQITTGTDLTVVNAPQLPVGIAKSFTPAVVAAGQPSMLRLTVTAPQDTSVSGITFTDTLPPGVEVAPVIPPTPPPAESCPGTPTITAVPNTDTISVTIGNTLNAGSSCNIDVYVVASSPGSYDNNIPANSITTNQGRTNAFDSNTANLRVTSLSMSKAFFPATVQANGISRLTITLENFYPEQLVNFSLADNLPGDATNGIIVASTPNATNTCGGTFDPVLTGGESSFSLAGGTIPAQIGGVPGICTLSIDVQGRDSSPSSQSTQINTIPVNQASGYFASLGVTVSPSSPAQATLTIRNLSIGVVKGFDPVLVYGGATSTMTVRLINPGTTALTGVAFTDDMALLSPGIILAAPPDFDTGTCGGTLTGSPGDSSFSFNGGTILPNNFCELTLSVVMNVNGNRTNRIPAGAVITANGTSSTQATEASLTNLPGISVNKVFNPNPVQINQVSTLTINIINTTSIPVVNMEVNDHLPGLLPAGLAIANPPNASNNCGGSLTASANTQLIQLVGGGLAGNASCQITVEVISTRPGYYVNTIPAGGITADNGVTNNDPATDSLTVGTLFSLGNRVWFDTNNNSLISTGEVGVDGVVLQLYAADATGAPVGPVLGIQTTSLDGYYRFDRLPEGDYVVVIPQDNFRNVGVGDLAPGDPLAGYWSSGTSLSGVSTTETAAPDPDNDVDSEDNGLLATDGAFSGSVLSHAVTLATNTIPVEPTDDADAPLPNPSGEALDEASNRTVDFGFYRTSIGNQIFHDANANNLYGSGDTPLAGVTVQLFASDGATEINIGPDGIFGTNDDAPGGLTTGLPGTYSITGLPNGDYIVRVTPPAGYRSTGDSSANDVADPDFNVNNNDNGIGNALGQVSSGILTMTAAEAGPTITVTNSNGSTDDLSVDFGFVSTSYSLGNRIWFDTDNSSTIDGFEIGISDVRVNLYHDDGTMAGVFDPGDTFLGFDDTDASGYYRFDGLAAGDYVVTIPADNFRDAGVGDTTPGDPLSGYWSSGTSISDAGVVTEIAAPDPDNNIDHEDNGQTALTGNSADYVSALAITLGPGTGEPTNDNDPAINPEPGEAPNNRSNRTADFGFYQGQLGNQVYVDENTDGTFDTGDTPLAGATVQLYARDAATEIHVGSDGILGTADDSAGGVTTDAGGVYLFSGLPAGDYIVRVTPPTGYDSTVDTAEPADSTDPNANSDDNDNGVGIAGTPVTSNPMNLSPGSMGALNNNTITQATGTTYDPTLDFGFQPPNTGIRVSKSITSVTFDTPQLIRITYSIRVENTGSVSLANIQVTDDLLKTFPAPASFGIVSVLSGTFTINSSYDGNTDGGANPTDIDMLAGTDSLAPGASRTITLVVLVDTGGSTNTYTNTAVVRGTPPSGPDLQDTDSIPGPSFIDPAVTKVVDPAQAQVGDLVTFVITLFNNGNVPATGVIVTDTLPDTLDYVSATTIDRMSSNNRGTITFSPPRTVQIDSFGPLLSTDLIEITILTRVNSRGQPPIQNQALVYADPPPGRRLTGSVAK